MPPRRDLRRRRGMRPPRRTILVVCEGEKTEDLYLNALKRDFDLKAVSLEIAPSGRDPRAIVRKARRLRDEGAIDEVWCVFDHEFPPDNAGFAPAVRAADEQGFRLAISNPSFEFWLLLHFRSTTRQFTSNAELGATLRRDYPEYEKNRRACYDELRDKQERAIANAERVLAEHRQLSPDARFPHPSTFIHELVRHLADQRTN